MKFFPLSLAVMLLMAQSVAAQVASESFTIQFFGGIDSEAPTTPTLSSVTAVSDTQIDVVWTAVTDNFAVSGYVLSRDGLEIATTTLTSYSDTGLTASTTYSYTVRAFDPSFNYSSSSNNLATTTLDTPVIISTSSTSTNSGSATAVGVRIVRVDTAVGLSTSTITVETRRPSLVELRWGTTNDYEQGYVIKNVASREHLFALTDLEPGVTYYYEVVAHNPSRRDVEVRTGTFTTDDQSISSLPINVRQFTALRTGSDVVLSWLLPQMSDFDRVRIVRSHLGFPATPQEGAIVYQGGDEVSIDYGILNQYSPVYYTAFVYDIWGNVSSGAVAVVYASGLVDGQEAGTGPAVPVVEVPQVVTEATTTIPQESIEPEIQLPVLTDLWVVQDAASSTFNQEDIRIDTHKPFTVIVPAAAVSRNLKTILLSIIDPTDNRQSYSYLLKINKDRTAYEANISPLGVEGRSGLVIHVYDYEAFVRGTYQTPVLFYGYSEEDAPLIPDWLYRYLICFFTYYLWLILLLAAAYWYWSHRGEDNA